MTNKLLEYMDELFDKVENNDNTKDCFIHIKFKNNEELEKYDLMVTRHVLRNTELKSFKMIIIDGNCQESIGQFVTFDFINNKLESLFHTAWDYYKEKLEVEKTEDEKEIEKTIKGCLERIKESIIIDSKF